MRVLMVGCGNMGSAMLEAWIASGVVGDGDAGVVETAEKGRQTASRLGAKVFSSAGDAEDFSPDIVVLAVKPQVMGAVAPDYRSFAERGATMLSIAAGLPVSFYEGIFGNGRPIVRAMPNTPAAVGKAMTAIYANGATDDERRQAVRRLLEANGAVLSLDDEERMHDITAISGSGPAYLFHFIEALEAAGRDLGLDDEVAARLARQTVIGAAALAEARGDTPAGTLREQVTSPGGTTAAGLAEMMQGERLQRLLGDVTRAARRRSVEMAKEN